MKFVSILAAAAVLGLASFMVGETIIEEKEPTTAPTSEPTTKPKWDHMAAKIVKVEGTDVTVLPAVPKGQEAKELVVKTDGKTVFVVEQEDAKIADLKPGMRAVITPREGTAVKIAAWTPKPRETQPAPKGDK